MSSKPLPGRSVAVDAWWIQRAREATERLSQTEIADRVEKHLGHRPSQSQISRCLTGTVTTLEIVDAFSEAFRLKRPVFFATSEAEAEEFERGRLRVMNDALIAREAALARAEAEFSRRQRESERTSFAPAREVTPASRITASDDTSIVASASGGGQGRGWRRGQRRPIKARVRQRKTRDA